MPRDHVVAFALYSQDRGVLKLTLQLFPLRPDEPREDRLELKRGDAWTEAARSPVLHPGWSVHFRVGTWDASVDVPGLELLGAWQKRFLRAWGQTGRAPG